MEVSKLKEGLPASAFAFRGYNVTNLGKSPELLEHAAYGPIVRSNLKEASAVCSDVLKKRVDLVARVHRRRQTTLKTYADAIALIMAMEKSHIELLSEFFGIEFSRAKTAFGYSLGEVSAIAAAGVIDFWTAMRVPLELASDCIELAHDVTLGILFSRGRTLPIDEVLRICLEISQEGGGVIGISALLSPNSVLLMGQRKTVDRFKQVVDDRLPGKVSLRQSTHRFPPLHTSITWQRSIPNRAALLMQTMELSGLAPKPPVLSMVTGAMSYNEWNAREILHDWVDHPQRLWDAVYETLRSGIKIVVHVGPEPNIIPATYTRLRDNVEAETKGKIGMRALTAVVRHPWLKSLLPDRTALLRAPNIEQVILEDWLLEHQPT